MLQLEILALRHQLGVLQRSVKATETDSGGSVTLGLAMRGLERLAVQRLYRQSRDRHRVANYKIGGWQKHCRGLYQTPIAA